jgi:integrase
MSHVQDLWFTEEPDPSNPRKLVKKKTDKYGKGMRYKARWVDSSGKERSKSFPDKKKGEADAFLTSIDNAILSRAYIDPNIGKTPFKTVCYEWLKGTSPDPNTRGTNERQMRLHILEFFEGYSVERAATTRAIRAWMDWLYGRGVAPFYIVLLYRQLASIMKMAHAEKYISENPFRSKAAPQPPKVAKKKLIPWDKAKIDAIYDALGPRSKIVIPLGAGLGLRRGEMLAVDAGQDLDRKKGTLHVQRQIRRLPAVTDADGVKQPQRLVFSLPKHDRTREIPVADFVMRSIDAHLEAFEPVPVTLPWKFADGPLVTVDVLVSREDGKTWYGELFHATEWKGAFREAGIAMRHKVDGEHQLRHFYASTQLANLVSVRELAEYLGHSDASLTLNTYGHLMPDSHERSRAAADAVWATAPDPSTAYARPVVEDEEESPVAGGDAGIVDLDEI